MKMLTLKSPTEFMKQLPSLPGCYLMKDTSSAVIYVGKAKDLKKRVASYFHSKELSAKTQALVQTMSDIDFIVTDNEVEALLLESKLIQSYQPRFNIELKNSLRYAYLAITNERFPRIVTTRKIHEHSAYFGPFTSGKARSLAARLSNRIFKIRVCKTLPKKACLLYFLGQCTAPCIKKVTQSDYAKQVQKAEMFLKGQTKELIQRLENEMFASAQKLRFEQAQETKEQIRAIQHLSERQKVNLPKHYDQNVIHATLVNDQMFIQIFQVNQGVVSSRESFTIDPKLEGFDSFLKQYYFVRSIPKEIIIPEPLSDQNMIAEYLSKMKNEKVTITVPQKGYKKQLLNMLKKNIEIRFEQEPIHELKHILHLKKLPQEIDCFDISNISGAYATGSCVRFTHGKPNTKLYRRFRIRSVLGINDFAMMQEVVARRYRNKEHLPDLIVVDGGKGQLSVALGVLHALKQNIPVISLAKKFEAVYVPNRSEPIHLPEQSYAQKLLQTIRDEAHRFAVTYHRLLRSKGMTSKKNT